MPKTDLFHLIIDGNNLLHRAHHTLGGKMPNGSMIGFYRSLRVLMERFRPQQAVICFDSCPSEHLLRTHRFPAYKQNRRDKDQERTSEEKEFRKECHLQEWKVINSLQGMEFAVLYSPLHRLEADDWIACLVNKAKQDTKYNNYVTIVSSDRDLWQLISPNVCCLNPTTDKLMTMKGFHDTYAAAPEDWPMVKVLAGDTSDNIPGVVGVGVETACKFVRNPNTVSTKKCEAILRFMKSPQYALNLELIHLPFLVPNAMDAFPYPDLKTCKPPTLDSKSWDDRLSSFLEEPKTGEHDADQEQRKGKSV